MFLLFTFVSSRSTVPDAGVKVKVKLLSHVQLFATPWTVAYQALRSMGFSSQEYWSGLPFPTLGGLPYTGIKPTSPASLAFAGGLFPTAPPGNKNLESWDTM